MQECVLGDIHKVDRVDNIKNMQLKREYFINVVFVGQQPLQMSNVTTTLTPTLFHMRKYCVIVAFICWTGSHTYTHTHNCFVLSTNKRCVPSLLAPPFPPRPPCGRVMSRLAVVCGGSRGIGGAVARLLAERGCRVAVVCRGEEAARAAVASLRGGTKSSSMQLYSHKHLRKMHVDTIYVSAGLCSRPRGARL